MVYLFLSDGFEECEAFAPLDILRRSNVEVKTVGIGGQYITGSHNITVKTDLTETQVELNDKLCGVILPGGMPGTINLENSPLVLKTVNYAYKQNKLVSAICAAPKILGNMGILDGKNATCFPGFENELIGAMLQKQAVVKDGNVITACGAAAAFHFGFEILRAIKGDDAVNELYCQMQFPAVENLRK